MYLKAMILKPTVKNAIAFSNRYINEGLRDRAITRDLDWGIDVPKFGYEDKKIYIWAENVLGYLSASKVVADVRGKSYEELWGENTKHYTNSYGKILSECFKSGTILQKLG